MERLHLRAAFLRVVRVVEITPPIPTSLAIGYGSRNGLGVEHDNPVGIGPLIDPGVIHEGRANLPVILQTAVQRENQPA